MPQHPTPEDIEYMQAHIHENHRPLFIGINVACLVVALASVGLRLLARCKISARIELDDWLICLAVFFITGHITCLFVSVRLGMARHSILVTDTRAFALTSLVAQTFYNLTNTTIKLSILSLYSRIFNRTIGWFNHTVKATAIFVVLYTIPQVFTYIFQCVPVDSLWTEYGPGKKVHCINFEAVIISFGIINIITDWFILLLPIPVVLNLRLERRAKWSICSLFLVGGFVCIFSIVRLMFAKNVETVDPAWDYAPIATVSTVEAAAGILAACMPTWRPLFKFLRSEVSAYFSSSNGGGSKTNSNPNALAYGNNSIVESNPKRKSKTRFSLRAHSRNRDREGRRNEDRDVLVDTERDIGAVALKELGTKRSETSMSWESMDTKPGGKAIGMGMGYDGIGVVVSPGSTLKSGSSSSSPDVGQRYAYEDKRLEGTYQTGGMGGIVVTRTISRVENRVE